MPSEPPHQPRVAVLGAGAIGLAIAWRLLRRGAAVDVHDPAPIGRGATWASAGLLAPTAGHGGPAGTPLDALCRRGIDVWPAFVAALAADTPLDVGLDTAGTLAVALDDAEAAGLRVAYDAWRAAGDGAQRWLDGAEVAAVEPALAGTAVAARLCPGDWQVDARRLVAALADAVRRLGGRLHEGSGATIDAVDADVVVLAAGAWSGRVPGAPPLPVRPVKGQMIALGAPAPPLRRVVFAPGAYLVPRPGGRLLVGATVEERGFDVSVTAEATDALRAAAARAVPSLGAAPVADAWAGLRPVTPDGAPLLGRLSDRLIVATGHARNGILLTPLTAELIADVALGGAPPAWAAPFAPDRFRGLFDEP